MTSNRLVEGGSTIFQPDKVGKDVYRVKLHIGGIWGKSRSCHIRKGFYLLILLPSKLFVSRHRTAPTIKRRASVEFRVGVIGVGVGGARVLLLLPLLMGVSVIVVQYT